MFGCRQFAVVAAITIAAIIADADQGPSAVGVWLADNGKSHVQIAPCGDKLCGTVTWLQDPNGPGGKPLTDSNNLDAALRTRPIIGLQLLQGLVADDSGPGQWEGGTIYDPQTGKTYQCTLTLQDPNTLRAHGCVGVAMFGRTQVWTRSAEVGERLAGLNETGMLRRSIAQEDSDGHPGRESGAGVHAA